MLLDGLGDVHVLALRGRVIAPHQPLKLRELADHFRHQIGLGEPRRALGEFRHAADRRRQRPRQSRDALDPLALRPQFLVEHDAERAQLGEALVERLAFAPVIGEVGEVGRPEMPGVGEPRSHDAAVARRDRRAAVAGDQVGDQQELVGELSRVIAQDKAFLIGADGGADHFRRDAEEFRLELAHQHDRPFDQSRDFLQQPLVLDEL